MPSHRENLLLLFYKYCYMYIALVCSEINETSFTSQINFLDHAKIIMCPLMTAVTYIDHDKNFKTYRFQTIQENGCCKGLADNLLYAYEKIKLMLQNSHAR